MSASSWTSSTCVLLHCILREVALTIACAQGDKRLFIRNDELEAAWKLFTPLLQQIESTRMVRCLCVGAAAASAM